MRGMRNHILRSPMSRMRRDTAVACIRFAIAGHAQTPERELRPMNRNWLSTSKSLSARRKTCASSVTPILSRRLHSFPSEAIQPMPCASWVKRGRPSRTGRNSPCCMSRSARARSVVIQSRSSPNCGSRIRGNGVGWSGDISRANDAKDEEALDAAIGAAGRARQFNSYFMTLVARLSEATAKSKSMPLNDAIIAVSGELAGFGLPDYKSISSGLCG